MATRRDVELGLQVTTAGADGIRQLKDEVDRLARAGGDAAPEFQQLSQVLDSLADRATALEAFDQIARDVQALSLAQESARTSAAQLATQLEQLRGRTEGLRNAEQEALTTLRASQQALGEKRDALALLKANTDAAERSESAYKNQVRDLTLAIINLRSQIRDQSAEFRQRSADVRSAAQEEKKLATELAASARQAQQASSAFIERDAALREASNTLRSLGVETDDLTASEVRLVTQVNESRQALERLNAEREASIAAAKRQAQEEERLAIIVANSKRELQEAAQQELAFQLEQFARIEAAEKRAAEQAQRAAQELQQAFGTVGVRSVQELEREIAEVRTALDTLRNSGTVSGQALEQATQSANRRIRELERNIREATGQLTLLDRASRAFQTTFGQTAGGFIVAEAFQRLAQSVFDVGRAFVDTNKRLEALRLGLETVFKDTNVASQQLDLLQDTANRAGVSFDSISDAYLRFSASLSGANVPLSQANQLFESVTLAAGRLGLSSDRTNRVLDALGQIAAKGVVSMEELRQQLGDSLPGALSIAARGLNLTEAELIKLVESGNLAARDFLPAFGNALTSLGGEVDTLGAAFARLGNLFTTIFQGLGDAGGVDILKGALQALGVVVGGLGTALTVFTELIFGSVRAIAAFAAGLREGGLIQAVEQATAAIEESDKRIEQSVKRYTEYIGVAEEAKTAQQALTVETARLGLSYTQVEESLTAATTQAKANVDLTKEQTSLTTQLADALGTEVEQLQAKAAAADQNAAALRELASVEQTNLNVLIAKRDAFIANNEQELAAARAAGQNAEALKALKLEQDKEIKALQDKVTLQQTVVDRATAQAQSAETSAAATRVETQALQDNAARVNELRTAFAAARAEVVALSQAKANGTATSDQLAVAERNLAAAGALYRDSLRDVTASLEAKNIAQAAEAQFEQSGLQFRLAQLNSLEATARAVGNETLATYAKIEAKRIEIQILQATVRAQIAEAEGSIAVARAKLEEERASGSITKVKEAELNATIRIAEAKIREARARGESVSIMEREIIELRNNTAGKQENSNASRNAGSAVNGEADSRRNNAEAIGEENAALAEQKRLKVDADGFSTGKDGQRLVAGSDLATRTGVLNFLKQAGVDDENARRITEEFADQQGNITYFDNPGQLKYGNKGDTISAALLRAAETVTFGDRADGNSPTGRALNANRGTPAGVPGAPVQPQQAAPTGNTTRTIRVELNGSATNINVASDADASALESVINQLAAAKGRVA